MKTREILESEREEIQEYLTLDLEQLYTIISCFASESNIYYSPEVQEEVGEKYFKSVLPQLSQKICIEWELCKKIDDPSLQDNVNLIATIADLVATTSIGIPPFVLATTLLRIGLRSLCQCKK